MNKRIRINDKLYEAVTPNQKISLPRKWKLADSDNRDNSTTYFFKNEDSDISVWTTTSSINGTDFTSISVIAGDHDHIYDTEVEDTDPNYYGLCSAADAGANSFISIVQEMSPGKIFSFFEWGSSRNTKDFTRAMKHEIDFEISKW